MYSFQLILQEEMFHKTLFTCCLEIVLRSYNDPRRFPWSLQVSIASFDWFSVILQVLSYTIFENVIVSGDVLPCINALLLISTGWPS